MEHDECGETNFNVLIGKEKLGRKNVNNTMKYIARIKWKLNQDFDIATATTDEEIKNLGAAGYEKYDERSLGATTISYYRRPKMFGNVNIYDTKRICSFNKSLKCGWFVMVESSKK